MNNLSLRERRLVAVGLLMLAMGMVWFLIVSPLVSGFEARSAQRVQLIGEHERQQRILASGRYWNAQLARQRRDADAFALRANSHETASELSKDRLTSLFRAGSIRSMRDVPAPKGWVGLQVDARLSLADLSDALQKILSAKPGMAVLSVAVNAQEAFTTGRLSPLDARVEISVPVNIVAAR